MAQSVDLKGYKNIVDAISYGSTSIVGWVMTKISNIGKTKEEKRWNNLEVLIRVVLKADFSKIADKGSVKSRFQQNC
ncbi:hypothetical protein JJQ58_10455 [Mammaliicoccus fleurettii]|uniref:Uncharacterized protein n=1 Tax=Mammaliicoccus fleurettii TaxID=150056 RepID=A0ABS5MQH2_9STAP|nr:MULTISPECIES: hypothetical protein [Mammaliicoccus]MBL0848347.1 hypothetical protein [Mammaliicoccus fleurettii]MBS3673086.1 hypothetical protein [Mammaliicoccus fleurettii]MBS3697886.1 hypothetical protein [Mammaliicoccus fleurettii]MEB7807312.1 hypothetical protein [Mammaliicoccus fleurettii]